MQQLFDPRIYCYTLFHVKQVWTWTGFDSGFENTP